MIHQWQWNYSALIPLKHSILHFFSHQNSIRQMKQTRYYLHKKNQPKPHNASNLFVGNLPINLSEFKYKQIVQQHLEEAKCKTFSHVGPIYAQYGTLYKKAAVGLAFDLHRKAIAALFLFRMDVLSENIAPHVYRTYLCPVWYVV